MTVSDEVKIYLKHKPYMLEAIGNRIVNFSALARTIQKELKIKNYHAVKIAIIRYAEQMERTKYNIEIKALPVLKENRITLLDGMKVIIAKKKLAVENVAEVRSGPFYVYLTDKNTLGGALKGITSSIARVHDNCSVIIIESPERLEAVPGIIAFLTSLFAEQAINIIELISVYTQTVLVVDKKDALRAYGLLSEVTH